MLTIVLFAAVAPAYTQANGKHPSAAASTADVHSAGDQSASAASAFSRGAIGVVVRQLYSDSQPTHRGPLAVMHVFDGSPAAKAGIHCSDFIIAINGTPVGGREFSDLLNNGIDGPMGGTVRLTVLRYDGSQSDIPLVYSPYTNPASDPFAYSLPGDWSTDPRWVFPLPWTSELAYRGFEDIFFSPNFAQTGSPEYHSFLFFWWVEDAQPIGASRLQSDMLIYFRGISTQRGSNNGFTPDLSKVSAAYKEDSEPAPAFGDIAAHAFSGSVTIYDPDGKIITLNSEVVASACPGSNRTVVFFAQSLQPRDGEMWKKLDAVRDTFRCNRMIAEN